MTDFCIKVQLCTREPEIMKKMKSIYRLTLLDWGYSSYFTKDKRVLYGKNYSSIDKCFGNP